MVRFLQMGIFIMTLLCLICNVCFLILNALYFTLIHRETSSAIVFVSARALILWMQSAFIKTPWCSTFQNSFLFFYYTQVPMLEQETYKVGIILPIHNIYFAMRSPLRLYRGSKVGLAGCGMGLKIKAGCGMGLKIKAGCGIRKILGQYAGWGMRDCQGLLWTAVRLKPGEVGRI